jgi:hypothetical protein
LAINFENRETTNKKSFRKIKGDPKMDIGIYETWICEEK